MENTLEVRAGYKKVNYSFILMYEDISGLLDGEYMDSGTFSLGDSRFTVGFFRNHAGPNKAVQVHMTEDRDCRAEFTFHSEDGVASVTVPAQNYTTYSPSSAVHIIRSLVCQDTIRLRVDAVVFERQYTGTVVIPPAGTGSKVE